ncbi:hypothetical protein I6F18_20995 [Bradyrhizobium sp. NBAIM32]|uniref:DUF6946 family protein n=1 Tax=Bradyrhizobium sp. NBAIM32 TaxID=2793809 RepID=UPI001CD5AAD3|nr:hypothetical protein [Bradyrhizobium sp. NBAIM32]MCA1542440.1 hypothetical protein [Bradyrhizobium sp. NBAIM32]
MKLFFGAGYTHPITLCTDVRDNLPLDRKYHYRDGRSMAEAAKCWCAANGSLPDSISKAVGSNELTTAHFEYPTRVWGGGVSMTDIMAFVPDGIVAVEAKVDEPFDELVSSWIFKEEHKNSESPPHRTAVVERYANALRLNSAQLFDIRYQLLQRTLAAALTARENSVPKAWMIVQSFSPAGAPIKSQNREDFDRFVELVGSAPTIEDVQVRLAWVSNAFS